MNIFSLLPISVSLPLQSDTWHNKIPVFPHSSIYKKANNAEFSFTAGGVCMVTLHIAWIQGNSINDNRCNIRAHIMFWLTSTVHVYLCMESLTLWPSLTSAFALHRLLSNSHGAFSQYSDTVFVYFIWQTPWYRQRFWCRRWSHIISFTYCCPQQSHMYNGASTVVRHNLLFPQWATKIIVVTRPGS
jgi:hypothetical protein